MFSWRCAPYCAVICLPHPWSNKDIACQWTSGKEAGFQWRECMNGERCPADHGHLVGGGGGGLDLPGGLEWGFRPVRPGASRRGGPSWPWLPSPLFPLSRSLGNLESFQMVMHLLLHVFTNFGKNLTLLGPDWWLFVYLPYRVGGMARFRAKHSKYSIVIYWMEFAS